MFTKINKLWAKTENINIFFDSKSVLVDLILMYLSLILYEYDGKTQINVELKYLQTIHLWNIIIGN